MDLGPPKSNRKFDQPKLAERFHVQFNSVPEFLAEIGPPIHCSTPGFRKLTLRTEKVQSMVALTGTHARLSRWQQEQLCAVLPDLGSVANNPANGQQGQDQNGGPKLCVSSSILGQCRFQGKGIDLLEI